MKNKHGKIHPWSQTWTRRTQRSGTGTQTDRVRDTSGQRHKWIVTKIDRDWDAGGQGHRRAGRGAETQTDRNRERDADGQRERETGTETDSDRDRNRDRHG